MSDLCVFDMPWVGRCNKPVAPGSVCCEEHSKLKCFQCGGQAVTECDVQIISLMCGMPECGLHKHHPRFPGWGLTNADAD